MLEITLVAMGNKMPGWVNEAIQDFSKRLREAFKFTLIEIPLLRRTHTHNIVHVLEKEAAKLHQAIPKKAYLVALDAKGQIFTSEKLAAHLNKLQHITGHICFVIGGPEGLPQSVLTQSQERLSLAHLTLPHPIARIVLLEALYRSWSILNNHPYHK
ncbi:MAG: 23S rRNA (pseudouridine(1915)-N(3))-methyltransferase RlmH [Gammaproteobacteria bacterium]|nr:23S rRNA (pseudouridine(1915)-N(3))-methyltransferase RlmH [Gammaproteobacteria bacterium]MCH9762742.1 23S rRNA (pseudouridine(1915)-N(3))-methyltransferase RlmH [Gammaproteobacteria bacterium]